jgi:transposase-like protein
MQQICYSAWMLATGLITAIDESTIQLIVQRVAAELQEIVAALTTQNDAARTHLTVDDVAALLGVARSTVYAHWREWGGYKLGDGDKSPIRFDVSALPTSSATEQTTRKRSDVPHPNVRKRRRRRQLLTDAPRLAPERRN